MMPIYYPQASPARLPESQELNQLKNFLMAQAKSPLTATILSTADTREMRGIKKTMEGFPLNPTIMEWATVIYGVAIHHPTDPSPATVHQWRNAILFVHERMKAMNYAEAPEALMVLNERALLPVIINDYQGIVQEAVQFQAQNPLKCFFNGMICFASHYAKHAFPLKMSVADYLKKALDLFWQTPFIENRSQVHRRHGWTLYVTQEQGFPYIKTLHLKASYHTQYMKNI